ncbi:Rare lipoprotein A precursor [hydrothermal vent metagenome]|uniref:Rare lipoprotein A n=1 Tax=hydrothermal vent metagenome TaxID=652676 RepID=A0A1W1CSN7_9ZZZZ
MNKTSFFSIILLFLVVGCSTRGPGVYHGRNSSVKYNYKKHPAYSHATMRPYVVRGVKYYPTVVKVGDKFHGNASWYGPNFHGKLTSNGERYNMWAMTAAHKTLPMNTIVRVTNRRNGKSAIVRINDRGPFVATRIIDLSKAAASKIGMIGRGTAPVTLEVLGFAGKKTHNIPSKKQLKKSPKSVATDGYALQIASFKKLSGAILTQEKYDKRDGYRTVIKDVRGENGRLFKVWLEGFKSEQEARDYKKNSIFKYAFIVEED